MVKSVLFALLLVAVAVNAQYGHSSGGSSYGHSQPSYGHSSGGGSYGGHAESFQNFHLEVGHQVPIQVPVYHHQPSYGHQSSSYDQPSHY